MDNHIEFEHMKYGEDKLFFFQLFGKVDDITMSTYPYDKFYLEPLNLSLLYLTLMFAVLTIYFHRNDLRDT
jgi:hypothetical protein